MENKTGKYVHRGCMERRTEEKKDLVYFLTTGWQGWMWNSEKRRRNKRSCLLNYWISVSHSNMERNWWNRAGEKRVPCNRVMPGWRLRQTEEQRLKIIRKETKASMGGRDKSLKCNHLQPCNSSEKTEPVKNKQHGHHQDKQLFYCVLQFNLNIQFKKHVCWYIMFIWLSLPFKVPNTTNS